MLDVFRSLPRDVALRAFVVSIFAFLLEGTTFGFPALQGLFTEKHVFEAACTDAERQQAHIPIIKPVCDAQATMLSNILITGHFNDVAHEVTTRAIAGAAAGDIIGVVVGVWVSVVRRQVVFRLAASLMAIGFLITGLTAQYATGLTLNGQAALIHISFVIVAAGHAMLFNGALKYAYEVRNLPDVEAARSHPYVTGFITGAYALAPLTPLLLGLIATATGAGVLLVYLVLIAVCVALFVFSRYSEPEAVYALDPPIAQTATVLEKMRNALSHWKLLLTARVVLVWSWAILATVFMDWYQSTADNQIDSLTRNQNADGDKVKTAFYAILPLAGLVGVCIFSALLPPVDAPITTVVNDAQTEQLLEGSPGGTVPTAWKGFMLTCALFLLWCIPLLAGGLWVQILSFLSFAAWRTGVFMTFYHHVIESYPSEAVLFLINGESCLAGALAFLNYAIQAATPNSASGYLKVNGIFVGCVLCLSVLAGWSYWRSRRAVMHFPISEKEVAIP